jgi:hypothetical protein
VAGTNEALAARDLEWVAERLFCWERPQQALCDLRRFVAHVMALVLRSDLAVTPGPFALNRGW